LCFRSKGSGAKHCRSFEGKISKPEVCTGTAEEVLHLLCFRREGSGAKQCSAFGEKISKSELCTGTAAELLYVMVVKAKHGIYCVLRRLSEATYGQSWGGSTFDVPNLERELMFEAKPRARAHVWSKTSSESLCLEPNLEQELMF